MKKSEPDISPFVVAGVVILAWVYLREDPQCDRGCQNRLDHLLLHVLPLLFKKGFGPTDIIGLIG